MKKIISALLTVVLFFSCTPELEPAAPQHIRSTWKMKYVMENRTGFLHTEPANSKEVDISFIPINESEGHIYGHTPTNEIFGSWYVLPGPRLFTLKELKMTKMAETAWGALFVDNILAAETIHIDHTGLL